MGRYNPVEVLGLLAGALTTGAYVPQLLAVWRARSGRGLTYWMLSIFNLGVVIWVVYGALTHSLAVFLTNAFTLVLSGAILALKLTFDLRDRRAVQALGQSA